MASNNNKGSFLSYKKLYSQINHLILRKRRSKAEMPDNHIFYNQLIEHFWCLIKDICFSFLELLIFLVVLIDGLLGLATIIYIINGNYVFALLCWIGISFLCSQFIRILEERQLEGKFTFWKIVKILFAIFLGSVIGAIIWPAFDIDFGHQVGIAFGALFGITLSLIIDIISLELRQKKL